MSFLTELEHLQIPFQDIYSATSNFSEKNFIVSGGFGKVYQGHSDKLGMVAIKRLDRKHGQGDREFMMELALLSTYKHENIVSLVGFCTNDEDRILVYKHERNGSLDKYLHRKDLTWIQRLQICIDAACGLKYLHHDVGLQHRIIHRDIKSSNILLDENWRAKISDFGLSKVGPANVQHSFLISQACGTIGYIDPEYLDTGVLTKKSDVYSFGVVLFEVLCGRPARVKDERQHLNTLAQNHYEKETLFELIPSDFLNQINKASLSTFSMIAYKCLSKRRQDRPTMTLVVQELEEALNYQLLKESRTPLILWHSHQNDPMAVKKLLDEDKSSVNARDQDNKTPLHAAALRGWIDVAKVLIESGADVNALDRWKNTPLADAVGAGKHNMIELLKSYGGLSYGENGSHFESRSVPPPLPNKFDWEIDPLELDFTNSHLIGKGSSGNIVRASWHGTHVAVKHILPSLSDDRLVTQDFKHEVNLLVKLRHPNILQFLGAVTDKKSLMLITEYLRGGDLHQWLKEKGALSPATAVNFALDIARGMAYLHSEPNVIVHRDLNPRNVLLVNTNADDLKVGGFGLSELVGVQSSHDVYKMTGETGSCMIMVYTTDRYMAPEVFKHRRYAMTLYEMLEGDPPLTNYEAHEASKYMAEGHRPTFRAKDYTPELRKLTEVCWDADPNKRPSFLEILKRLEKIKEVLISTTDKRM